MRDQGLPGTLGTANRNIPEARITESDYVTNH
jgi:hypothetical protein